MIYTIPLCTALVTGSILQGYNFIAAKLDHWCDPLGEAFANWTSAERRQFASVGSCEYWARRDYGEYANMSFVEASERSKAVDDQGVVSRCMLGPQRWEYESTHYGLTIQNEVRFACTVQIIHSILHLVPYYLFKSSVYKTALITYLVKRILFYCINILNMHFSPK